MTHFEQIKQAVLSRGATGISFKETPKKLIVYCPGYSSYSAAFDNAFDKARELNISYRGMGHGWGQVYTLVFSVKTTI